MVNRIKTTWGEISIDTCSRIRLNCCIFCKTLPEVVHMVHLNTGKPFLEARRFEPSAETQGEAFLQLWGGDLFFQVP